MTWISGSGIWIGADSLSSAEMDKAVVQQPPGEDTDGELMPLGTPLMGVPNGRGG